MVKTLCIMGCLYLSTGAGFRNHPQEVSIFGVFDIILNHIHLCDSHEKLCICSWWKKSRVSRRLCLKLQRNTAQFSAKNHRFPLLKLPLGGQLHHFWTNPEGGTYQGPCSGRLWPFLRAFHSSEKRSQLMYVLVECESHLFSIFIIS